MLGVQAAFWNLRYGERYDVTHPVNLRHLLRDIANGEVLSCMMSVPSTGWNVARAIADDHFVPVAPPLGKRKIQIFFVTFRSDLSRHRQPHHANSDQICTQCQRFNVPSAIENPEKSLRWMTSQSQELSKMRNVYKMTFDFCAFGTKWRKRTTILARYVDSADVWALDTMRCCGHKRCSVTGENTCNSLALTLIVNARVHTEAESIR